MRRLWKWLVVLPTHGQGGGCCLGVLVMFTVLVGVPCFFALRAVI